VIGSLVPPGGISGCSFGQSVGTEGCSSGRGRGGMLDA
jgi:hypothetical protein